MPGSHGNRFYSSIRSVTSTSFIYPFAGIYFFLCNRAWWPLLGRRLIPLVAVSVVVFGFLFTFAYIPQVVFLALFGHGFGAWLNALFLVLGEGQVIIALLFEALLVDEQLVDTFDAIFVKEGLEDMVAATRMLDPTATNPVKMLGKPTTSVTYAPFSFRQTIEFILFLPLNFIPYVGVPIFLVLTGARAGPFAHWRYFKLRGLTKKERNAEIKLRRWQYTWFGTMALLLQLIPVLSMMFLLTSAAGSALWAVKLEKKRRAQEEAAGTGQGADSVERFTDDPV